MPRPQDSNLTLRALIILGVIAFAFYLGTELGLIGAGLEADRSYLSYLILGLYFGATLHWLWLAHALSAERQRLASLEAAANAREALPALSEGSLPPLLANLQKKAGGDASALVGAVGDDLANRHALGHFLSDVLLKLGLVGTVVGFILMLLPVGEFGAFDPERVPELLAAMSAGMSVALYTTLAGLVTSTLLKAQYYLLDASLARFVNRLVVFTDVHMGPDAS